MSTTGGAVSPIPAGGVPFVVTATGGNSAVTATVPGTAGKTIFVTKLIVSADGATTPAPFALAVTGTAGAFNTTYNVPALGSGAQPVIMDFDVPLPASAPNIAVVVSLPALGAGNTVARVVVIGYVL